MSLFRVRRYGSADWLQVIIQPDPESEENEDLEQEIARAITPVLNADDLHVQQLNAFGNWEDLE